MNLPIFYVFKNKVMNEKHSQTHYLYNVQNISQNNYKIEKKNNSLKSISLSNLRTFFEPGE